MDRKRDKLFLFLFACVLSGIILFHATQGSNDELEAIPELNFFGSEVWSFLEEHGGIKYSISHYFKGRNSDGTCLYINHSYDKKNRFYVLNLSDKTVTTLTKPGNSAFLNDALDFVAWSDDLSKEVHFACGMTLPTDRRHIHIESSGRYFYHSCSIRSVDEPYTALVEANIYPDYFFVRNNHIYLFERIFKPSLFEKHSLRYLSYIISEDELIFEKEGHIPGFRSHSLHVADMDQRGENLILKSRSDPPFCELNRWYLYNMKDGTMTPGARVGSREIYARFLAEKYFKK
jgi:hypothetical protein